jgi:hypothetical protein
MNLGRLLGVIVFVAAGSGPARADILVWRDASGVSHYTNDLSNVPPEYRAEAMTVAKDWARAEPPPEPVAMPAAATVAADSGAALPARDGYEAAFLAGFRAAGLGESTSGSPPASGSSVRPNAEIQPQNRAAADRVTQVLTERHQSRAIERDASGDEDARSRVSAAPPSSLLQGPARPPPASDR